MRASPIAAALLLLCACDSGAGAPCVIDSDCADFSLVCLDSTCATPGGSAGDGGDEDDAGPRDAGEAQTDAGSMDAGPVDGGPIDAAPEDAAAPVDAAPADAAPTDGAALDASSGCVSLVEDWAVTSATGSCTDLMDATVTFVPGGSARCGYTVDSSLPDGPRGSVTTDSSGAVTGMLTLQRLGSPSACTGAVSGDLMTLSCTTFAGCTLELSAI